MNEGKSTLGDLAFKFIQFLVDFNFDNRVIHLNGKMILLKQRCFKKIFFSLWSIIPFTTTSSEPQLDYAFKKQELLQK